MSSETKVRVEPVASKAMDNKMREIWAKFDKGWVRRALRDSLPPTRVRWMGVNFVVHPRDNFTEFKMWELGRPPEHEATAAIAEMLKDSNAVVVDVGANAGAFGLPILAHAGAGARGVFFEPNPVMRARLTANIDLNDMGDAQVFDCALSDQDGSSQMFFPRNGNLGQGRIEMSYRADVPEGDKIEVAVRTLPGCLKTAQVEHVDFLKVDVEGLEDKVIAPLLEADEKLWPGMLYFEVEHQEAWSKPVLQMLSDRGYAEIKSFGKNLLFKRG